MTPDQREWTRARDSLVRAVEALGFPGALGGEVAKLLGSPRAMERMEAYLRYEKPKTAEILVDEALAIRSDIEAWREKKAVEEYNIRYNEMLYYGLGDDEDPEEEDPDGN